VDLGGECHVHVALVGGQKNRPLESERFARVGNDEAFRPFQRFAGQHVGRCQVAVVGGIDCGFRFLCAGSGLHGQGERMEFLGRVVGVGHGELVVLSSCVAVLLLHRRADLQYGAVGQRIGLVESESRISDRLAFDRSCVAGTIGWGERIGRDFPLE